MVVVCRSGAKQTQRKIGLYTYLVIIYSERDRKKEDDVIDTNRRRRRQGMNICTYIYIYNYIIIILWVGSCSRIVFRKISMISFYL